MRSSLGKAFAPCVLGVFVAATVWAATPLEQIRNLSYLPPLDLAKLKAGHIVVERGPLGDFARGVQLQSCYFIQAPLAAVGDALLHWDPVQHHELDVRLYREYVLPGSADDFKPMRLRADLPNEKWLLERTGEVTRGQPPRELHLTNEEAASIRGHDPATAWQQIFQARSAALARGGMTMIAPYAAGQPPSPGSELRGLLGLAPKVKQHFEPILNTRPLTASGRAASEVVGYWEADVVHEHTTLQMGIFAAQKGNDSWQLVNCLYFPSDTYFMALDLFQLWPVDGGTLVWQAGFVSAPFRAYLGGVDRYFAGKLMTSETIDTIKAFRADLERRR